MLPTTATSPKSSNFNVMRPRTRGSAPLLVILVLVSYIIYLHSSGLPGPPHTGRPGDSNFAASSSLESCSRNHGQIALSADKTGWANIGGASGASIFQRPLRPSVKGDMRIAVASMNTDETTYDHISLSSKFGYATKHNYAMKLDLALPEGMKPMAVWHKLNMIEYLVRTGDYDWIWWIDYDTVITNTTIKLEDIIAEALHSDEVANPDNIHFILTADCWPLNAGSMLLRSSPTMLTFLSEVWKCGVGKEGERQPNEQDCIRDILTQEAAWKPRALWIPQTKINAFPDEISCWDKHRKGWQPGDFVAHFPGAWAHLKGVKDPYGMMMRKYNEWVDKTSLNGIERYQDIRNPPVEEEPEIVVEGGDSE